MSQQQRTVDAGGLAIDLRPERDRERMVVMLSGELDLASVGSVEAAVQELYATGFASVVLDLRELTFIDSTGLRLLLRLDEQAWASGVALAIIDGEGPVRRLLRLTRLADRFTPASR